VYLTLPIKIFPRAEDIRLRREDGGKKQGRWREDKEKAAVNTAACNYFLLDEIFLLFNGPYD
jgi:hypothetical protein